MNRAFMARVLAAAVVIGMATVASAQASEPTTLHEPHYETTPDQALLRNGLWTLGVTYTASAVTALVSPRSVDDYLFVPVAGPWMDLARREDNGNGRYGTLWHALLIADGVVQAVGASQVVLSLIFPETRLAYADVDRTTRHAQAETRHGSVNLRALPLISPTVLGVGIEGRL